MKPGYSRTKLVSYVVDSLESGTSSSKLAHEIAAFLVESGKTSDLGSILRDAQELRAQKYGVVELTARSAHTLDTAQITQIEAIANKQYTGTKSVKVHQVHDESVIGGANLSFPQASLDVTVQNKLNQLRKGVA